MQRTYSCMFVDFEICTMYLKNEISNKDPSKVCKSYNLSISNLLNIKVSQIQDFETLEIRIIRSCENVKVLQQKLKYLKLPLLPQGLCFWEEKPLYIFGGAMGMGMIAGCASKHTATRHG